MNMQINDNLSFKENDHKFGLRGHVKIEVLDKDTNKKSLWYESDNIIPISGFQFVLLKMFNLHLDSTHDPASSYEQIGQDTSTVIPDLNNGDQLNIGVDPSNYTVMNEDFASNHFVQGFMIGNGGSGEDTISTKNTDYCFIKLRHPIPFQETTTELDGSMAGQYLGVYRDSTASKKYFIKKFDDRAHIYHNWWKDGQKWDYIDPITQANLGPAPTSTAKTDRIETYVEVGMSIDTKNNDCIGYFESNQGEDAVINELGLVAFDTVPGTRSQLEQLYNTYIKKFLNVLFSAQMINEEESDPEIDAELIDLATNIFTVLDGSGVTQSNLDAFKAIVEGVKNSTPGEINYDSAREELCDPDNIEVTAMYNQSHVFVYETDKFLYYVAGIEDMTVDEAQRIKLVTYYTFKSIPLQSNWKIMISYRIYAN